MARDQKKLKRKGERDSSSQISSLTCALDSTSSDCAAALPKVENLDRESPGNEAFSAEDNVDNGILASATVRFKGIRQRTWGTWVAEVREPATKKRVWLGSYSSAEEAARVYDMALMLLQSPPPSRLNYPHDQRPVIIPSSVAEALVQTAHVGLLARQSGVKKRAGGKKNSATQGDKKESADNVSAANTPAPPAPTVRFASEWVEMSVVGASVSMREFTRADLPPPSSATPPPASHASPAIVSARASPAPAAAATAPAATTAASQAPLMRVSPAPHQTCNTSQPTGCGHVTASPSEQQCVHSGAMRVMSSVSISPYGAASANQTCLPGSESGSAVQHLGLPRSSLTTGSAAADALNPSQCNADSVSNTDALLQSARQQQQQQHVESVRYWPSTLPAHAALQHSVKQEAVAAASSSEAPVAHVMQNCRGGPALPFVSVYPATASAAASAYAPEAHERKPSLGLEYQLQQQQQQQQLMHYQQMQQQQQQLLCYHHQQQQQQQQQQLHYQQQQQQLYVNAVQGTQCSSTESPYSSAQLQAWTAAVAGIAAAGSRTPPPALVTLPSFPSSANHPVSSAAADLLPAGSADSEHSSMLRMGLARPRGASSPQAATSPERRAVAEVALPTNSTTMLHHHPQQQQQQQLTVGSVTVQGGMVVGHDVPLKKGQGMVSWAGDESPSSCLGSSSPPALILPCADSFELPLSAVSSHESDIGTAGRVTSLQLPGLQSGLCIQVPKDGSVEQHGLAHGGGAGQLQHQQKHQHAGMGRTASQPILLSPGGGNPKQQQQQQQQQEHITSGPQSQAYPSSSLPWATDNDGGAASAIGVHNDAAGVRSQEPQQDSLCVLAPLQAGYHVVQQLQVQQVPELHAHNQQLLQQSQQQQQQQEQQQEQHDVYSVAAAAAAAGAGAGAVAGAVAVADAPLPAPAAAEGDMCDADFLSDPAKEVYFMDDSEFEQLSPSKLHSFFPDQPMGTPFYHCGDGGGGLFMLGGQVVDDRMFDEFLLDPDGMDAMEDSSNGSVGLGFEDHLMEEFNTPR